MIDVSDWDERVGLVKQEHVRDIVAALYDSTQEVIVHSRMSPAERKNKYRGLASWSDPFHTHIWVDVDKTVSDFMKGLAVGGNLALSPKTDPRLAVAQVLAHEVRHASQRFTHSASEGFWGRPFQKYTSRACEREARLAAEEALPVLRAILEIPEKTDSLDSTVNVMDAAKTLFAFFEFPTRAQVEDELSYRGILNVVNVKRAETILEALRERGRSRYSDIGNLG